MSAAVGLPPLTEKQWQAQVILLAKTMGFRVYHTRVSIGSTGGYPDLLLAKPGRLPIWIELKAEKGKLSPMQEEWLELLSATGCKAFCARPSDWDMVCAVLQ